MKPGVLQLVIVLVVVLIIFGPSQLPKLGKIFGSTMKSFKDGMSEAKEGEAPEEEVVVRKAKPAASGKRVVKKVIEVEVDEDGNEIVPEDDENA